MVSSNICWELICSRGVWSDVWDKEDSSSVSVQLCFWHLLLWAM